MTLAFREPEGEVGRSERAPLRLEAHASGIALVWFDDPERKVNLLDAESLPALRRVLDALRGRSDQAYPRALILLSGKEEQFIAGADVSEFDHLSEPAEAEAKSREVQQLFDELSLLPYPTVAAINGPCLGGGTELALAMRYRVASNSRKVAIGLPEVQLGILPGFGGTQRLPRLIGLLPSLDLLLTGRSLDSRRAYRVGLVDEVLPHERFSERAIQWTEGLLQDPRVVRRRGPPLGLRVVEAIAPLRASILAQVHRRVLRETHGHYPASLEIIRVLRATWGAPSTEGLKAEREAVARLLFTPESRNLRRIFALREEAKRRPDTPLARRVDHVAVMGAGTMGGEIAYLFSRRGGRVRLRDLKPEPILRSLAHARSLFDREVSRGRLTRAEMEQALGRIAPVFDLSGLKRTDLVLEAVVEDLPVKQALFRELEAQVSDRCVFATNTSSLSVRAMSKGLRVPGRVVGMHFFNPATRMPLVEVIRTDVSEPAAVQTVIALARRLGKTPVLVADAPGFLVNRVLMPYLTEAVALVERGQPARAVDRALRDFGMPVGPLELLDEIGLDVARKVAHVLHDSFGTRLAPVALIDRLVAAGALGKKSELGFYSYENGRRKAVNPDIEPSTPAEGPLAPQQIVNRLLDAMVNEAALALEEHVVARPDDVDLAMVLGTGFPPFHGGLLRYADAVGAGAIVERLARRQQEGAPAGPCGCLQQMALSGRSFYKE
ncbi:MAG: fatty acid oxidation complex subunit alpha FadJ [Candidatus Eisenbacteria bacterium]|uniref:enoyl-CoA hydratase n=1 Tax=Eiseniibacteriota bacterium TaxID=2212470 RepID=A0A538SZW4_UNCEI|nr:MAG: fatty acid oxidation complex subunit alpha FadJ [Candidatus Eisenbacteria bacterium]